MTLLIDSTRRTSDRRPHCANATVTSLTNVIASVNFTHIAQKKRIYSAYMLVLERKRVHLPDFCENLVPKSGPADGATPFGEFLPWASSGSWPLESVGQ